MTLTSCVVGDKSVRAWQSSYDGEELRSRARYWNDSEDLRGHERYRNGAVITGGTLQE